MAHRNSLSLLSQRRLVNLHVWPGLQLKLPAMLLAITVAFIALLLANTEEAYGALIAVGLEERWIRTLAEEIRHDYFVVSIAIGIAYAITVLGTCLAATHRLLGPIVAIERQLQSLKKGEYAARVHLRAGHPLTRVARDLNELGPMLCARQTSDADLRPLRTDPQESDEETSVLDRLVKTLSRSSASEDELDAYRTSIAS